MNPRQFLRALGHMAGEFIPWQLVDVLRGRDYNRAVLDAADALADVEADDDAWPPNSYCTRCGSAYPGAHTCLRPPNWLVELRNLMDAMPTIGNSEALHDLLATELPDGVEPHSPVAPPSGPTPPK